MSELWPAGIRVVEINCGTGVDAAWLTEHGVDVVATDAGLEMVAIARERGVDARCLAAESIGDLASLGPFDGVLSNFGGLNCIEDLDAVVEGLARCVRVGGTGLLCVMGPVVPWEWLWFLLHGAPRKAVRRLAPVTMWRGTEIRYPSIAAMRRRLAPSFDVTRVWALGALIPPSYVEPWARRHPRVLATLGRVERRIESWPGVGNLADHYVLEIVRK